MLGVARGAPSPQPLSRRTCAGEGLLVSGVGAKFRMVTPGFLQPIALRLLAPAHRQTGGGMGYDACRSWRTLTPNPSPCAQGEGLLAATSEASSALSTSALASAHPVLALPTRTGSPRPAQGGRERGWG